MNREDIIKLAREAGGVFIDPPCGDCYTFDIDNGELERFFQAAYAAGAAAERQRVRASMRRAFRRMAGFIRADERDVLARAISQITMIPTLSHGVLVKLTDVISTIRSRGETK